MVAEPPTLEDLLEQTATLIADAGDMPKRMEVEAERLNNRLTAFHYTVECKRQELWKMAHAFIVRWEGQADE